MEYIKLLLLLLLLTLYPGGKEQRYLSMREASQILGEGPVEHLHRHQELLRDEETTAVHVRSGEDLRG